MTKAEIIQILTGFVGSLGFAVLFNIRGRRLVAAALGGLFSWTLFVVMCDYVENEAVNYFIVALVMSLYAEVLARVLFRLTARRGALPFLPRLGSRLHLVLREKPSARLAAARQYVAEALEDETQVRVTDVQLTPTQQGADITALTKYA